MLLLPSSFRVLPTSPLFRNVDDITAGSREYGRNGAGETWQLQGFDVAAASCLFLPEGGFAAAYGFCVNAAFDAFENNLGIGSYLVAYACTDDRAAQRGFKLGALQFGVPA